MSRPVPHPELAPLRIGVRVDGRVLARLQRFVRARGQVDLAAGTMVDAALTSWLDAVEGERR